MYLLLSIFLCTILGISLFFIPPYIGIILSFGIVIGSLFRALYILNDIHKRISDALPRKNLWEKSYEKHVEKKESEV